jgi:hypothetical protein
MLVEQGEPGGQHVAPAESHARQGGRGGQGTAPQMVPCEPRVALRIVAAPGRMAAQWSTAAWIRRAGCFSNSANVTWGMGGASMAST